MIGKFKSVIACGLLFSMGLPSAGQTGPAFPGLASATINGDLKGLALIEELNCAACHEGGTGLAARSKKAPRLAGLGSRVNPAYLQAFLANPHEVKPGTTMPDLLGRMGGEERKQAATALTHFLLSLKKNDFALQAPDAVAAEQGRRLFHARGCAACHSPRDEKGVELLPKGSVPLGALEKKYSFRSLVEFLREPHKTRPSGRMPDLRLPNQELERIAHYLLQNTRVPGSLGYTLYRGEVWEGLQGEKVKAERAGQVRDFDLESLGGGKMQQDSAVRYEGWLNITQPGRHSFFLTMNGGSLLLDGKAVVELPPSDRRGVKSLDGAVELAPGWHKIELTYFHTGREPRFAFEWEGPQFKRGTIPPALLSVSSEPIAAFEPLRVDPSLAARGRDQFSALGCANCHDDLGLTSRPGPVLAKLDASRGCLSRDAGPWPRFDLGEKQRGEIAQVLPLAENPRLTDGQQIAKTLATFNCVACHEREGLGGVSPTRNALFTGTQPSLGDQGRIPPPLTHVGAKLRPEAIAEALLLGKRQRDYVDAAMPQFGEANVGHLVELFGKVDKLEAADIPTLSNPVEARAAGHEMIGANGMSCITCHEFNGQKSGEMAAIDLGRVTGRLNKNWFHLFLRQPSRFHPTIIMPSFWPGGQSTRPNLLGGDTAQQIEALWTYLADGPRAKKPSGLSRQSNELRVGDTTELCRGRGPAGYRGIAVGYPERLSLAFDSGEMALRQLWKGNFVSVDFGSFQPRGTDLVSLPPGVPFHRLKTLEDNWPYKGKANQAFPQDQGYEFRGYHLDAARRPTFRYLYGGIAVEDYFEDVRDQNGQAYFRRTLRFDAPAGQPLFYFRAAAGKGITASGDRSFTVEKLKVRISSDHRGTVRGGDNGDLLIPLTLPAGRSILTLDYQW